MYHYFHLVTSSREITDVFFDLAVTLTLAFFCGHCLREFSQTLSDYNLAPGLAIYTRFDDLDLISRSQICQNHKLQIVPRFLSNGAWLLHT